MRSPILAVAGCSGQDVGLSGVGSELGGDGARPDDEQPIGDALRLLQVGGGDQHGSAVVGEFGNDPVDLLLGADVYALRGFGQQQERRPFDELPCEHHLLRISPDRFPTGWFSSVARTANRFIRSLTTVRSLRRSTKALPSDNRRRWPIDTLNAMDWKENIPSVLRLAGSSAIPASAASRGDRGATARPSTTISPPLVFASPWMHSAISATPEPTTVQPKYLARTQLEAHVMERSGPSQ